MTDVVQQVFSNRISEMRGVLRVLVYLGLGAIAALGQAPLDLWPLTILALALIFALFRQTADPRRAALLGWAAGTGYFMVALSWIVEPFLVDIAQHGWMAPFALIFLSAGMALYWALSFGVARMIGGSVALVVSFVVGEALRGIVFTGFAWAQVGHIWIDTPMLHWASIVGALGLCAMTMVAAIALWQLVSGQRLLGGVTMAVLAAFFLTGPLLTTSDDTTPAGRPTVRLIQPNAPQHEKWDPQKIPIFFNRQLEYTAAGESRPDLIVWPETSVPVLLNHAESTLASISDAAGGAPIVLGIQRLDGPRFYNSAVFLGADGQVTSIYDKHHLVPFGEFVPFGDTLKRFGIAGMAARDGNGYSSGPGAQVIDLGPLGKALPLICYEGVFARDVAAAPERPDFLLMITNDAWFGEVSGPYQHLAQARLRSVEQGLPMIRAANTGVSAVIDATGRITHHLPLGQAGWIDAPLPLPHPPTVYARIGDWPIAGLLILMLGASVMARRLRR